VGVQVEGSTLRIEAAPEELVGDAGLVDFAVAGTESAGEFRCAECGYGAVVHRALPQCPMCAGTVWERRGSPPPRLVD
jgi:rubrerythrin